MPPTTSTISSPEGYQARRPSSPSLHGTRGGDGIHKHHRRLSSTGGGRAWTEEEEAYLLRTRMHKMPYKHIAAHLNKTELACRLHYHQMSYGTNRRKRTGSVSSTASSSYKPVLGSGEGSREQTPYTYLSPVVSPASSPEPMAAKPTAGFSDPSQQRAHVPILPKPNMSPLQSLRSTPPDLNKSLRLDTSFADSRKYYHYPQYQDQIDPARLRALYESHSASFWSLIASEYSQNSPFSGGQLEEAFFRTALPSTSARPPSPPTPGASPQDTSCAASFSAPAQSAPQRRGFQAINEPSATPTANLNTAVSAPTPTQRCSVSALLTVEKDVRAPRSNDVTV
ncbi:hypothetical protein FQN54_005026 [Arachnomyces sp. PD_36]|nr:hypothetical protein FQN54_005026 [Arachnomyces sp. PD_36]